MTAIPHRHKKTGNPYHKLGEATDCTNSRDGTPVALYTRSENRLLLAVLAWALSQAGVFVREAGEFAEKFEPAK